MYGLEAAEYKEWWDTKWIPNDDSGVRDCASVENRPKKINGMYSIRGTLYAELEELCHDSDDQEKGDGIPSTYVYPSPTAGTEPQPLPQPAEAHTSETEQEDSDLSGWSVQVTKSRRLKPMRAPKKVKEMRRKRAQPATNDAETPDQIMAK